MNPILIFDYPTRLWQVGQIQHECAEESFYIVNEEDQFVPRKFTFQDDLLIYKNCFVDLNNLYLNRTGQKDKYGLTLSTLQESLSFYGTLKQINKCYEQIKRYTIQENIDENYDFLEALGSGTFAGVYKCIHKQSKQIFACKIIIKRQLKDDYKALKQIAREVQIMRKFNHYAVNHLYEVYESMDAIFLIIEYLSGGELWQELSSKNEVLSEDLLRKMMKRLLLGLIEIHKYGIHRDLKAENIILRKPKSYEDPVIADFGLADINDVPRIFIRCGTLGYTAPEILADQDYDYKVDLFSLGVVFHLACTGELPFSGQNSQELIVVNIECLINFNHLGLQRLSSEALYFMQSLLNQNPNHRPSAKEALSHAWFQTQEWKESSSYTPDSWDYYPSVKSIQMNQEHTIVHNQTQTHRHLNHDDTTLKLQNLFILDPNFTSIVVQQKQQKSP